MKKSRKSTCPQCQVLAARLAGLEAEVARLREQLAVAKKDSTTSSKPPSSDLVKPKPASADDHAQKRSRGGQPGHPMHQRDPFPPEQITAFHTQLLHACPHCG